MRSMDDMMSMSFDELRGQMDPVHTAVASTPAASLRALGGGSFGAMPSLAASARPQLTMPLRVRDHAPALDVYFSGPGAADASRRTAGGGRGGGVVALDAAAAAAVAKGKNDFVLFEPLDDAVRDGRRLVVVAPLGAGRGALASSQVYLASSFARWLREGKVDGAGRPFGEVKDEEPTLRKHFTRAQLEAILAFGDEAE